MISNKDERAREPERGRDKRPRFFYADGNGGEIARKTGEIITMRENPRTRQTPAGAAKNAVKIIIFERERKTRAAEESKKLKMSDLPDEVFLLEFARALDKANKEEREENARKRRKKPVKRPKTPSPRKTPTKPKTPDNADFSSAAALAVFALSALSALASVILLFCLLIR